MPLQYDEQGFPIWVDTPTPTPTRSTPSPTPSRTSTTRATTPAVQPALQPTTGYTYFSPSLGSLLSGLQSQYLSAEQFAKQLELQRKIAEMENKRAQEQLALNYLNLLAQLRGPQDWLVYANIIRNAQQTQLPAWLQSLYNTTKLPAWNAPSNLSYSVTGQGAGAPLALAVNTGGKTVGAQVPMPYMITPKQWAAMTPSERAMLQGMVEAAGGFWDDYVKMMMASWPTRNTGRATYWR